MAGPDAHALVVKTRFSLLVLLLVVAVWLAACGDSDPESVAPTADTRAEVADAGADVVAPSDVAADVEADDTAADDDDVAPDVAQEELPAPSDEGGAEDVPADIVEPPTLFDPILVPEDLAAFDRGVRSGDPFPDGVLASTHFGGDSELVALVLSAEPEGLDQPVEVVASFVVELGDGGWSRVVLDGLQANQRYRYCFVAVDDEGVPTSRSPIGEFGTAPAPDALAAVTFGGNTCSKQVYKPFGPLDHAAEDDLAFFILGGDTTYADGANTVADYRAKWDEALLDPSYVALTRDTPMIATWDDHEVENNWNPEEINASKLAAATQVFFEQLPTRQVNGEQTIWRRIQWGRTLDIFVLDCRSERKPSTILTDNPIYISPEQMDWLKAGLSESDAVFKLIVNSVPITDMPPLFLTTWDRWAGYAKQRDEIIDHINNGITGVVWLTGDFHFPAVTHVGKPGTAAFDQWEILMGPTAHIPNPLWLSIAADPNMKEQFPFVDGTLNFTRFHADPSTDPATLTVEFVDANADVFHVQVIEAPVP